MCVYLYTHLHYTHTYTYRTTLTGEVSDGLVVVVAVDGQGLAAHQAVHTHRE